MIHLAINPEWVMQYRLDAVHIRNGHGFEGLSCQQRLELAHVAELMADACEQRPGMGMREADDLFMRLMKTVTP